MVEFPKRVIQRKMLLGVKDAPTITCISWRRGELRMFSGKI